jgi:hypothetical protein
VKLTNKKNSPVTISKFSESDDRYLRYHPSGKKTDGFCNVNIPQPGELAKMKEDESPYLLHVVCFGSFFLRNYPPHGSKCWSLL